MGGTNSWRTPTTAPDWMREVEKRILHEERRPNIRTASDIMGPGLGPYCVRLEDWNADETLFNGFWYTEPGAFNQPVADRYWMGYSLATQAGFGLQRASEYYGATTDVTWPRPVYVRKFSTPTPDNPPQWSLWRVEDGSPPGLMCDWGGTSAAPNGWFACNGTVLSRSSYPDLFAVIGTRWNTGGESSTQFRLPNVSGKVIRA